MRTWPALLVAPLLALADQSVAYALVPWSCAEQDRLALHAVHAAFLVAALATLMPDWRFLRPHAGALHVGASQDREVMLCLAALGVGGFSALVIAAMWVTNWVLSPCLA